MNKWNNVQRINITNKICPSCKYSCYHTNTVRGYSQKLKQTGMLPSIEDQGQTDHVTLLTLNLALICDLGFKSQASYNH